MQILFVTKPLECILIAPTFNSYLSPLLFQVSRMFETHLDAAFDHKEEKVSPWFIIFY